MTTNQTTVKAGTPDYAAQLLSSGGGRTWQPVLGVPSVAQLIRGLARLEYTVEQIAAICEAAGVKVRAGVIRYRVIEALGDEETLRSIKSYGDAAIRRRSKDSELPGEAIEFARETVRGRKAA